MTFLLIFLLFFQVVAFAEVELGKNNKDVRNRCLEQAQVWHPTDVSKMNILFGSPHSIAPNSLITCRYIEPKAPPRGTIPKFKCKLPRSGEEIRVKYGSPEINAEVASSRLLWALGFYSDEDYFVRIKCLKCPEKNAWKPAKNERRVTRIINDAMMERNFRGEIIQESEDQGWSWNELDKIKEKSGGASRTQIDSYKLLGVFIQHSDCKHDNQRIECYQKDILERNGTKFCEKPVLMISDLGSTFGGGETFVGNSAKMNFENWKKTDIWNREKERESLVRHDQPLCVGKLTSTILAKDEGLADPEISEEGRKFLADLLNQLSLKQIHDLFRAAGVEHMDQTIDEKGIKRKVTVEDWTVAFIKKRNEINDRKCPVLPKE